MFDRIKKIGRFIRSGRNNNGILNKEDRVFLEQFRAAAEKTFKSNPIAQMLISDGEIDGYSSQYEKSLSQPVGYYEQLAKSRGMRKPTHPHRNQILSTVSMIMDMREKSPISSGYQILPKYTTAIKNLKPTELDQSILLKKIFDYWSEHVNSSEYYTDKTDQVLDTGQPGLDYIRKQFHQAYYDGYIVYYYELGEWKIPGITKPIIMPKTVQFIDPNLIEPYDIRKPENNLYESILRGDKLSISRSNIGYRFNFDSKQPLKNDDQIRFVVIPIDRSIGEIMPTPFIIKRGIYSSSRLVLSLMDSDYQTILGLIRSLLVITFGSELLLKLGFDKELLDLRAKTIIKALKDKGGLTTILGLFSGEQVEFKSPDVTALNSAQKYTTPYRAVLEGLGISVIQYEDNGRARDIFSPIPLTIDIATNTIFECNTLRTELFYQGVIAKNDMFRTQQTPWIRVMPITQFMNDKLLAMQEKYFNDGITGYTTFSAAGGINAESELIMQQYEQSMGYQEIFKPRPAFVQSVKT